jgi:LPS export ABC transporter protein LptC
MRRAFILLCTILNAWAAPLPARAETPNLGWLDGDLGQVLLVRGMTFVASEGSSNDILLKAERARFYPDRKVAELEQVEVEVAPGDDQLGFEMRCDEGQLNLATQDFLAMGHVVGTIEGGRQFEALWVAYDEEKGLLYTDEPVLIVDQDGRYRGGGFRYFVNEQRFILQGGAVVVQEP